MNLASSPTVSPYGRRTSFMPRWRSGSLRSVNPYSLLPTIRIWQALVGRSRCASGWLRSVNPYSLLPTIRIGVCYTQYSARGAKPLKPMLEYVVV
jgi:hypothetical protein